MLKRSLTFFISDLHLSEDNEPLTDLFLNFLEYMAPRAKTLYILGDFFEMWLGDDDNRPLARLISTHLHNLAEDGIKIYLMRGNRDIMMGERFAKQCNAVLLKDPTVIQLYGEPTLLLHGDSLCTLDTAHQRYRKLTLHPLVRWIFLHLPLILRKKIASFLRKKSKKHQLDSLSLKKDSLSDTVNILDVNRIEVIEMLKLYECSQMIHGHTHQPKIHHIKELSPPGIRVVLGDWGELGSVLICGEAGSFELQCFT